METIQASEPSTLDMVAGSDKDEVQVLIKIKIEFQPSLDLALFLIYLLPLDLLYFSLLYHNLYYIFFFSYLTFSLCFTWMFFISL